MSYLAEIKAKRLVCNYTTSNVPIPLNKICKELDIHFLKFTLPNERQFLLEHDKTEEEVQEAEGFAYKSTNGERIIKVFIDKSNIPHSRQVAANGIGHHMLNHLRRGEVLLSTTTSTSGDDTREKEADDFARHLLVPINILKEYVRKTGICTHKELANAFNVEQSLIERQLKEWFTSESTDYKNYVNALQKTA